MRRVLIADDSESIRQIVRAVLEREGWSVCGEAANGLRAVELAAVLKPDLVLLDFLMPRMDGLHAAEQILSVCPRLPIILYTLHKDRFLERRAKAIGLRKVISKNDIVSELIACLEGFQEPGAQPVDHARLFDIFRVEMGSSPRWISSTQGFQDAKLRMEQLALEERGRYFVYDSGIGQVRARMDTRSAAE